MLVPNFKGPPNVPARYASDGVVFAVLERLLRRDLREASLGPLLDPLRAAALHAELEALLAKVTPVTCAALVSAAESSNGSIGGGGGGIGGGGGGGRGYGPPVPVLSGFSAAVRSSTPGDPVLTNSNRLPLIANDSILANRWPPGS